MFVVFACCCCLLAVVFVLFRGGDCLLAVFLSCVRGFVCVWCWFSLSFLLCDSAFVIGVLVCGLLFMLDVFHGGYFVGC